MTGTEFLAWLSPLQMVAEMRGCSVQGTERGSRRHLGYLPTCPGLRTVGKQQASPGAGVLGLLAAVSRFLDPSPLEVWSI